MRTGSLVELLQICLESGQLMWFGHVTIMPSRMFQAFSPSWWSLRGRLRMHWRDYISDGLVTAWWPPGRAGGVGWVDGGLGNPV